VRKQGAGQELVAVDDGQLGDRSIVLRPTAIIYML
jgi:hypothetical protein